MSKREKSLVGDPVVWPGLVYSPINIHGLLYALGAAADKTGLIFEEFSVTGKTAVGRRKAENGWEKIEIAFAMKSSEFTDTGGQVDLLICWVDDSGETSELPKLELSKLLPDTGKSVQNFSPVQRPRENPENVREDFLAGDEVRESFEETIRQLDDRIKKLKSL